jgi:ABC-type nickel/cobalt efflux system permease component RcnA
MGWVTGAVYVRECRERIEPHSRMPAPMSEPTQTSHERTADEAVHGTREVHHPGDIAGEEHGQDDHGETHGHDDHAHPSEALGPVDVAAWGAFVVGLAAGLLIAICLVLTIAVIGA